MEDLLFVLVMASGADILVWLLWFVGQYADGLVELGEDFLQSWVGFLNDECGEVFGLVLLHLSGLHDVGIATRIGVEPSDEEAAAECLAAIARFTDVEQDVGVGGKESLDEQEDGLAELLVERRGLMALVVDGELVGTSRPYGVVVHETNDEDLTAMGFYVIVTSVFCPYLIGRQTADAGQIKWIHVFRCSVEVVPDEFSLSPVLPVPAILVCGGWTRGMRR